MELRASRPRRAGALPASWRLQRKLLVGRGRGRVRGRSRHPGVARRQEPPPALGTGRLGMLDTIREFAEELLDEALDGDDLRRRHAAHFLTVAESANLSAGKLRTGGQRLDIAMVEHDNFRGALAWTVDAGEITLGLRIATAFEQLWVTDDPAEGVRWFERMLEHASAPSVSKRCPGSCDSCVRERTPYLGVSGAGSAALGRKSRPLRRARRRAWSCRDAPPSRDQRDVSRPPRSRSQARRGE